jgi:ketosteroid isomerase-like protein
MKRQVSGVLAACLLFGLVAVVVSAQTTQSPYASPQAAQGDAEQQLKLAQQQLLAAARAKDREALSRLVADEATWVTTAGKLESRDEILGGIPNPPQEVTTDQVHTFGDVAVVTGMARFDNGSRTRFVQEWANRGGQWRVVAHQGTPVGAAPAGGEAASAPMPAGTSGSAMSASEPTLSTESERAVWQADRDLLRAFMAGDSAAYAKLTADEYVRVSATGDVVGKSEWLETVKQNAGRSPGKIENGGVQITVNGDSARVVATSWGTVPGGQQMAPARVTRIFVKRDGQWQQAAIIFTQIARQ